MKTAIEIIEKHSPCAEAKAWMAGKTPQAAWEECSRPDWMLWLLMKIKAPEEELRYFARWCALSCLDNWPDPPQVVLDWLMTGDERYRSAARSAARSAGWSAAGSAGSAAWSAAWSAARSAGWSAARSAGWSAAGSAGSAGSAAWSAAWSAQCDMIREIFPWSRMQKLIQGDLSLVSNAEIDSGIEEA